MQRRVLCLGFFQYGDVGVGSGVGVFLVFDVLLLTVHSLDERLQSPGRATGSARSPRQRPPGSATHRIAVPPGMSSYSNLDRKSFQQLLASAFEVQQSQMDSQSLSAIVEVQRLMAKGELDVDGAMHFIVNCARNVANATGVASCLLKRRSTDLPGRKRECCPLCRATRDGHTDCPRAQRSE